MCLKNQYSNTKQFSAKDVQRKQWNFIFTQDETECLEKSYNECNVSMIRSSSRSMKVLYLLKFPINYKQ